MDEFFTWGFLATFADAATATAIFTQFIKNLFAKLPTQILSYGIAIIVLAAATGAAGVASGWGDWAIIPLNAVLVSLAANGAYSGITRIGGTTGK
jgi:hypothetical protein